MSLRFLKVDAVPPFRLDLTAWALRRLPVNGVDRFERGTYSRVLVIGGNPFGVFVTQPSMMEGGIEVEVRGAGVTDGARSEAAATIARMLGVSIDLSPFYKMARQDHGLWPLVTRFAGLKPPRFPTMFEGVVNGIACQQLSLHVGITLLNRLSAACGRTLEPEQGQALHAFPRPQDILGLPASSLREMGFSTKKAEFLLDISRAVHSGTLDLQRLASLTREEALRALTGIRGVGRWTAEYLLLRGAGDLSTFPGDDVGGRNRLQRRLGISGPLAYGAVREVTSKWQPFAGFVYFHLLLDELAGKGHIAGSETTGE